MKPFHRRQLSTILYLPALLALSLLAGAAAQAAPREVAIGVFAYRGERAAVSDWAPLAAYLDGALPGHRFRLRNYDADGLRRAVATAQVDLVVTNPGYYIALESAFGVSRIATLAAPRVPAIGSVVLVRADRHDIATLADLAGKRVAAVGSDAFAGYLVAAREMVDAGVDPESDLAELRFVGLPMFRTIEAIMEGQVDAGIVKACMLEQMIRQGQVGPAALKAVAPRPAAGFPCLVSTRLYPDWPIAVTRQADPRLAKDVARALLAMPEGEMGWTVAADYQPVHDLYRTMRLGPYAALRDGTPRGLLLRYWRWVLAGAVLLAALLAIWALHTLRVRQLVLRRTRELQLSLAAREAAEHRARDKQEQLDHLSRLSILGELAGNLAHELNQPLATIATYARSVPRRQRAGRLTREDIEQACGDIAAEAERAGGIIGRIRAFAKKRAAVRGNVDVHALAQGAVRLVRGIAVPAPDIAIGAAPDACAWADAVQIEQVLLNLLKNAMDAGRGLPAERQAIAIGFEVDEHHVVTRVTDRGCGMPPERFARLFEAFFTTKPDGLGLGLSICKGIVEAHGGRLWAQPGPAGTGMTFLFSLPRHPIDPAPPSP